MALLTWLLFLAAAWLGPMGAEAVAEAAAGPDPLEPIKFPPMGLHGPAAPPPHYDEDPPLSTRLQQTKRPVGRAAAALRGVAGRLRLLVAPSGVGAANESSGNLLMSPLSVAAALGQMLLGAQGETRGLLADLLAAPSGGGDGGGDDGVPDLDYHQQFKALLETLGSEQRMRGPDAGVELRLASAFFSQRGLPLRVDFQHAIHDLYQADVRQLDFRERPAVAQATVNAWARQATRGRIPTVLSAPLPPSAAALVASAVYFRGAWEWPFDSDLSVNGWFRMSPRRRVAVKFMRSHFPGMRYAANTAQGYRLVVLPYKDGETAMYVILPDQKDADLTTFSTQMSLERMLYTARTADPHTVTLVLPRMSISGSFSLKEPLSKLKNMRRLPRSVHDVEDQSENWSSAESWRVNQFRASGSLSPPGSLNRPSRSRRDVSSQPGTEIHLPKTDFGSEAAESKVKYMDSRLVSLVRDKYSKNEPQVSGSESVVSKSVPLVQNSESESIPFTVLSGGSFEYDNVRRRRSTSGVSRNAPEPRSQESQFPRMQIAVGMSSPQISLRREIPRSSIQVTENSEKSKVSVSGTGLGVGEMLPSVRATPVINKPMVLGVPLTIMESDDSNILPKLSLGYQNEGKDHNPGKTLQHSFRDMDIPYPYRPVPGQDLKPPFDKPPKLLTIKDILPKIVVGTSVTFPFDQSNESVPLGSKLTTRPSGLIHKKQRERVGSTQVRSVSVAEDEDILSEGSVLPAVLVENNSTVREDARSSLPPKDTPTETEVNVDVVKVPLSNPESQENSTHTTSADFGSSTSVSSTSSPDSLFPTPIMSFLANVEYSEPIPIISSSVHIENSSIEDTPALSNSSNFTSESDLQSHTPISSSEMLENRFSSGSSNLPSSPVLSPNSSTSSVPSSSNSTPSKLPEFPEIEETGDLLNPLAVGAQGLWTIRPQPANYDVYDDVVLDLTGASTDRRLRVSDALHHVWLEVTETGTEAAAVTATVADYSGDNQVMKVDRPFVLAIVHEPTEALLFLAAVSDPTGGSGIRTDIPPKKATAATAG